MFSPINTFNDVKLLNQNTLVICDIDETLFYWKKRPQDFHQIIIEDFPDYTQKQVEEEAIDWLNMYRRMTQPSMTDSDGFNNLRKKIESLPNSKIIFLTARNNCQSDDNKYTRKHFESNKLNYDDFAIHYTDNKISKGEYIKNNIKLDGYRDIIFIDDYVSYIKTVNDALPNIICYKFEPTY
jgi:hypothetical protein